LALGLGSCYVIGQELLYLPGSQQLLTKIPVKYLPTNYVVICAAAWLFSLVAALYPALTAARQDPCTGLRL